MQILIFEGIATSGKSTLISKLEKALKSDKKILVAYEDETHEPIKEVRDELHLEFYKNFIQKQISKKPDVLIVDRLYMTQAFRAKRDLGPYKELEEVLGQFNAITVFLMIDESLVAERIQNATEHRDPEWSAYVKTHGQEDQMTSYYVGQQRSQLELLKQSKLPYKIFDTSNHDYEDVTREILKLIKKPLNREA
jgi:thymidylate kinase